MDYVERHAAEVPAAPALPDRPSATADRKALDRRVETLFSLY
jgi:hypothetical protein